MLNMHEAPSAARRWSLVRTAPPAALLSTADLKAHLRVQHDDEDALIDSYAAAAVDHCQRLAQRAFLTQGFTYVIRNGAGWRMGRVQLPMPPLAAVAAVRVRTTEEGAASVIPALNYHVDSASEPGVVTQLAGFQAGAVHEFDFLAGTGTAANVPPELVQAVRLLAAHWYENRESGLVGTISKEIEFAVSALVEPYRMRVLS
jgi:uncharacterized phiE125 gp8 family phage protein